VIFAVKFEATAEKTAKASGKMRTVDSTTGKIWLGLGLGLS